MRDWWRQKLYITFMLCSNLLLGLLLPTLMSVSCEPVEFQGKLMTVRLLHNQRLPSAKTKKKKKPKIKDKWKHIKRWAMLSSMIRYGIQLLDCNNTWYIKESVFSACWGCLTDEKNGVSRCIKLWIEPFTDHNIALPFPADFLFHKTRNAIKENDTEPQDNKAWLCSSSLLQAVSFWETEYWLQLGAKWLPILQQEPETLTSPTSNLICSCLDYYKSKGTSKLQSRRQQFCQNLQIVAGPTFFSVSMGDKTSFFLLSFPRNNKTLHSRILPSTH